MYRGITHVVKNFFLRNASAGNCPELMRAQLIIADKVINKLDKAQEKISGLRALTLLKYKWPSQRKNCLL